MTQRQRTTQRTTDDEEAVVLHRLDTEVDEDAIERVLAEIDDLLAEEDEAKARREFREKIKTIGFLGRRSDPCADAIRLPEPIYSAVIDAGLARPCEWC